jgi:hypothetical protein
VKARFTIVPPSSRCKRKAPDCNPNEETLAVVGELVLISSALAVLHGTKGIQGRTLATCTLHVIDDFFICQYMLSILLNCCMLS